MAAVPLFQRKNSNFLPFFQLKNRDFCRFSNFMALRFLEDVGEPGFERNDRPDFDGVGEECHVVEIVGGAGNNIIIWFSVLDYEGSGVSGVGVTVTERNGVEALFEFGYDDGVTFVPFAKTTSFGGYGSSDYSRRDGVAVGNGFDIACLATVTVVDSLVEGCDVAVVCGYGTFVGCAVVFLGGFASG